jgi:hypothetical protein
MGISLIFIPCLATFAVTSGQNSNRSHFKGIDFKNDASNNL